MTAHDWPWALLAIIGLAATSVLTRGFFLFSDKEIPLPQWLKRGLKYAPLAALSAVIAPEILISDGSLIHTWQDARIWGALAGIAYFLCKRGILGVIVCGMLVFLPLRIGLGW